MVSHSLTKGVKGGIAIDRRGFGVPVPPKLPRAPQNGDLALIYAKNTANIENNTILLNNNNFVQLKNQFH